MKKEGTVRKGINIIDFVFVVIIAAVVIFAIVSISGRFEKKQYAKSESVTYSIEVTNSESEILDYIKEGQKVYDGKTKSEIGIVVSVYDTPSRTLVENHAEKSIEYVNLQDRKDIVIEIEAGAVFEYPDVTVNGISLKIGKSMDCLVGDAAVNGILVGLEFDEQAFAKEAVAK